MSVLDDGLLVVHCQMFGSSVHFSPPTNVLSLVVLNGSTKWKVVAGFNGTPVAFKTPAAGLVVPTQSPAMASVIKSPSILNPPAGIRTGAIPVGGGIAKAANPEIILIATKARSPCRLLVTSVIPDRPLFSFIPFVLRP